MTCKTAMLTGAGALALASGMMLAPEAMADPIPAAASYADLLEPVPDAMARLHADDAMALDRAQVIPAGIDVGIGIGIGHHHHHHHHSARWFRAHGFFWNGRAWVPVPPPPRYHHHHHHHHHWR